MPAVGVTGDQDGVTKMADQSKMAAPMLPTTTDTLNVARCASPSASSESREKTPPRPRTPSTAAVTTTDQSWKGNGRRCCRVRSRRPRSQLGLLHRRNSQCHRGGGPLTTKEGSAAEIECTASTQWKGGKDHHRSWKGISTSREVCPG